MHHYARAIPFVATVLLTTSCSDSDARLIATQPSRLSTSPLEVTTTSATAFVEPVTNPFCPTVAPFSVSLGVTVRATGSFDVVITGIRSVFTDMSGRQAASVTLPMLPVTLPAPGPTQQFGSAVRTFPLTLGIGCGTGTQGTIAIIVETTDQQGRRGAEQVRVAVR